MRLNGRVNKIERLVAQARRGVEVDDEKRVFHLNVRLKDETLEHGHTYGYGQMHFILHGQQIEDFVDLGAKVDIYVVPIDQNADVPQHEFEDMRARIYELEGRVETLTKGNETLKNREESARQENQALRERLRVAMDEVMRLEARQGIDPPAPAQLTTDLNEGTSE